MRDKLRKSYVILLTGLIMFGCLGINTKAETVQYTAVREYQYDANIILGLETNKIILSYVTFTLEYGTELWPVPVKTKIGSGWNYTRYYVYNYHRDISTNIYY